MNSAAAVLFSFMAVMAQGAVIVDPTRAVIGFYGGASRPSEFGDAFGTTVGPLSFFGSSRAGLGGGIWSPSTIGGLGFGAGPISAIGAGAVLGGRVLKPSAIEGLGFGAGPLSAAGAGSWCKILLFLRDAYISTAIVMDAGALSLFGIMKLGLGAGSLDISGYSRCIGEACIFAAASNCIGAECVNVLAESQVRQLEVQKQLQDQLELQNLQFSQQQQILNEQKRLQQQRILIEEAALTRQAVEQEAQLEEQRAFVDVAQRLQRAQLLEQMKAAQINLAASQGLWNPNKKTCTAAGCFDAANPLVAAAVVLFSCMAIMAQGAVIADPARVAGFYGGAFRPSRFGGAFGTTASPFRLFGNSSLAREALRSSATGGGFDAGSVIGASAVMAMDAGALSPFGIRKLGLSAVPINAFGDSRCIGEACILAPVSNCIGAECANVLAQNQVIQLEVQKQLQDQLELQNVQFAQQQQMLNEQKRLQQQRILSEEVALTQQAVEQEAQLEEQRALVDVAQRLQRAQLLEQMKTAQINLAASKGLSNSFMSPLVAGIF
nr:unnamed protein product [Callosobruchus analis]